VLRPVLIAALCLSLTGCASIGVFSNERSSAQALSDANATLAIKSRMGRSEGFYLRDVDIEVTEGVVLLSGEVPRPEDRIEAERIAWSSEAVQQVGNEIHVGGRDGARSDARDEYITQQVRARLLSDPGVRSVNYNVEVHRAIVYLLGVARSEAELDRASRIASLVPDVERVVTYVRVAEPGR